MPTPYEILNRTKGLFETAESAWLGYAKVCIRAYNGALTLHTNALNSVKEAKKLQSEEFWKVLNLMLSIAAGPAGAWAGRFLAPVKEMGADLDPLVANWVKDALKPVAEPAQSHVKDTLLGKLKNAAIGGTKDSYEPVVESTLDYGTRLDEGIYKRAHILKKAMDEHIYRADHWTVDAALSLEKSFRTYCPFLVDEPTDSGPEFEKAFKNESELGMWVAWALARDEKWWRKEQSSFYEGQEERKLMGPIVSRLAALGVPTEQILSRGSGYLDNRFILDMVKLIDWAKNRKPPKNLRGSAPLEVCRKVDPNFLQIKRHENVCYPAGKQ
jgi:hypothetical protein